MVHVLVSLGVGISKILSNKMYKTLFSGKVNNQFHEINEINRNKPKYTKYSSIR